MNELASFESRLIQATDHMNQNIITDTITQLKNLSKDISSYLTLKKIQQNDRLSEIQITVFNNLACLYQKKGKYRTSLYHLQIAEQLENKYINHKYNDAIPLQQLEKMSMTYSNLSAIQSKLGMYKEAIQNAKFAIQLLSQNQQSKEHRSLVYLYYNYSFLLDVLQNYKEASKYVSEGLALAKKYEDKKMIESYEGLQATIKEKIAKKESRKLREIKKNLRGELGIVKTLKQIQEKFLKEYEVSQPPTNLQIKGEEASFKNNNISSLKEYINASKKHLSKPFFPHSRERNTSAYTTLNHNRKVRNYSYYSNARSKKQTIDEKNLTKSKQGENFNQEVKIDLESNNTNRVQPMSDYLDYGYLTGKIRPNNQKFNRTSYENKVDFRIKSKKLRLQEEISDLNKKNQVLEKIIEKIYDSEKKSRLE